MPDPAVDAASRVWDGDPEQMAHILVSAAREMAKPIRGVHEVWARRYANRFSGDALVVKTLLEDLAPLIYTSEELGQ
ncbi:hypothetical protein A5761_15175 [Mycolicibacterium setense]|uniref:hypothetical protein n=1 Tax=Mycolicibacterium setense TaxID=431269 RepID=UPI0007EB15B6|nr:hypothetical protein [Mycolicibacterium setense]OBB15115.1 hypothetical protein A5761_15175 [Mycolicibacterium setense]